MRRALAGLASVKLTLLLLALTGAVLLWGRVVDQDLTRLLAVPFGGMFLNLIAAVVVHRRLRTQAGLLVFHLALAALALIAAIGRLMALDGRVEVAEGTLFDMSTVVARAAPLHRSTLEETLFAQGPFQIEYHANMQRKFTRSTVMLPDDTGAWREKVVGDDSPLVIGDYRLYTTPNKGFAPVLTWTGADGRPVTGAVHLPSYPANFDRQGNEWRLPDGSRTVVVWLELTEELFDEKAPWTFRLPTEARLALVDGETRVTVGPGEEVEFAGGKVRFERMVGWMGYSIFYDPSLPWLMGATVVAILALAWHVLGRLRGLTEGPAWRRLDEEAEAAHA